jgi:hypothetical protein
VCQAHSVFTSRTRASSSHTIIHPQSSRYHDPTPVFHEKMNQLDKLASHVLAVLDLLCEGSAFIRNAARNDQREERLDSGRRFDLGVGQLDTQRVRRLRR